MKQANNQAQSTSKDRAPGELRVVAIKSNPAPDAQDRLRRLFTLLLEHTAGERQSPLAVEDDGLGEVRENSNGG